MCGLLINDVLSFGNCPLGSGVAIISYKVMKMWDDSTFLNLLNSIDSLLFTQVEREWEKEVSCYCKRSSLLLELLRGYTISLGPPHHCVLGCRA